MLAQNTGGMRRVLAQSREEIALALKATELAVMLGVDGPEPDLPQRLVREIRDGLVSRVRTT